MLEKEFKYFKDHQEELVKKHEGKYLVIVGKEVVGVYDSEIDAYTEAKKRHKPGTFLKFGYRLIDIISPLEVPHE